MLLFLLALWLVWTSPASAIDFIMPTDWPVDWNQGGNVENIIAVSAKNRQNLIDFVGYQQEATIEKVPYLKIVIGEETKSHCSFVAMDRKDVPRHSVKAPQDCCLFVSGSEQQCWFIKYEDEK